MAYVYEALSDESWKELLRLRPSGPYLSGRPRHWCNDHENNIQLVCLGGRGDSPADSDHPPTFYLLSWHKEIIRFESRYTIQITGSKNDELTITQEATSIYAPSVLKIKQREIQQEIPRALFADWQGTWEKYEKKILAVNVTLSSINFI